MPELPEVEVTRLRLEQELAGLCFRQVIIRVEKLRLPVAAGLTEILPGQILRGIGRRGKYLLLDCTSGWLLVHLGMTGFLRVLDVSQPPGKHDHLDFIFDNDVLLRFYDPRKFGIVIWLTGDPLQHPLLADIGPEPLLGSFDGAYLTRMSKNRKVSVKQLIMDSSVVAGVGNIYANEALFRARIRPDRAAGTLTDRECYELAEWICEVLSESIGEGSSFRVSEETVAYYPQSFKVYGRGGMPCAVCGEQLCEIRLGGRSTVLCKSCQK